MNRRALLGATAAVGTGGLAGCLASGDGEGELLGEHTADSATTEFEYECEEADLFEDVFYLTGRATSMLLGSSAVEWHIDIEADRDLMVGIYHIERTSTARVPAIQIIDPAGEVVLDEQSSSSLYAITTETNGRHVLRIRSREWTSRERWRVDVSWYHDTGCTRFTQDG